MRSRAAATARSMSAGGGGRIARLDVADRHPPRRLFGDHMVLPAEARVQVQGFGTPGAAVEVSASWGARGTGVVGGDGRWSLLLATGPRGGEHTVTMRSAADEVVLHDVLLGDVWLASGQSNMEMPIGEFGGWKNGVADWQAEVAKADHHDLRVFTVAQRASGAPLDDVEGHWEVCTPATAKGFSATAYFFARDLLAAGTTPIGIVVSAWGGTVCEAWVSGEALAPFPEFAAALAATRAPRRDVGAMLAEFWQAVPAAPADGGWQDVTLPATWSADGLGAFDGIASIDGWSSCRRRCRATTSCSNSARSTTWTRPGSTACASAGSNRTDSGRRRACTRCRRRPWPAPGPRSSCARSTSAARAASSASPRRSAARRGRRRRGAARGALATATWARAARAAAVPA